MKSLIFFCLLVLPIISFSQEIEKIEVLLQGELMPYDSLPFKHSFQKAALDADILHTTLFNPDENIQTYVSYQLINNYWKLKEIGLPGTFYAGNRTVGRILAGGSANIAPVPDLANERDFVQFADSSAWFTSDKSGFFQIYELKNKAWKNIEFENLTDKHIINLWNSNQSVFFDVYNAQTHTAECYSYSDGKISSHPFDFISLSFSDSMLVYIKNGKLFIHKQTNDRTLCSFAFVFTDTTYNTGISFTEEELEKLQIDSNSVKEGVLTEIAKEKLINQLQNSNCTLNNERKSEFLGKLTNANSLVNFSFLFTDTTFNQALQLNEQEQEQLNISNEMIDDGVFNSEAKSKLIQVLNSDSLNINDERKNLIADKLYDNIKFYGFFADTFTYITTKKPVDKIESNGFISVEGLENFLKRQKKDSRYYKLLSILATRAWIENKKLAITDTVIIQVGCYSNKINDFVAYVSSARKMKENHIAFLKSLPIYCQTADGLYYYRTKTSVKDLLRIKEALYFDRPFILKNSNRYE